MVRKNIDPAKRRRQAREVPTVRELCRALDQWAYIQHVKLDFSRPGKPTDNAFIESFGLKPIFESTRSLKMRYAAVPQLDRRRDDADESI